MQITFALLAASLAAVSHGMENICETTDGSPYLHHVNPLIDNLVNTPTGPPFRNVSPGCSGTITDYTGAGGGAGFMLRNYRCSGSPGGMPCAGSACGGISPGLVGSFMTAFRDACVRKDSNGDERVQGIMRDENIPDMEIRLFKLPS
ncbi:hypothetical protein BDW59DRAFT_158441 [Aspergillus cavernicola]|uniref:Uncharacterized protein n=1 Tax=Aspergillus cavernicola TaxID=176166 RepID=A0ABR4IRX9_9EURO